MGLIKGGHIMIELFNEYKNAGKMSEALDRRNMVIELTNLDMSHTWIC